MGHYPAMPALITAVIVLLAKFTLLAILQAYCRARSGMSATPDLALTNSGRFSSYPSSFIQRGAIIWRYYSRNVPLSILFIALAFAYAMLGAPLLSAQTLYLSFVALCSLDCLIYLVLSHRWSIVAYLAAWIICWIIAVRIVMLMFWNW